jgi:hypothetical protein
MLDIIRCTTTQAVSVRGKLFAGVSAIAFFVAAWSTPGIAQPNQQTAYGTARGYIDVGLSSLDAGPGNAICPSPANRAFIQWAGMTAGIAESFYDFYSVPAGQYAHCAPAADTGDPGWVFVHPYVVPVWAVTFSAGGSWNTVSTKTRSAGSDFTLDPLMLPNAPANPTAGGFVGSAGFVLPIGAYGTIPFLGNSKKPGTSTPPPLVTFGVEANAYFFAGDGSTIEHIPGGPGSTPTGTDNFNVRDSFLFTAGGWVAVPISQTWRVALTGGFAEADIAMKYNCGTYCTTGSIPTFSD